MLASNRHQAFSCPNYVLLEIPSRTSRTIQFLKLLMSL
uniref:Uncharacterized protein n=1 Tax=Arundo donax TaxID=35708 RepID=A0A0A9F623_ARUDO